LSMKIQINAHLRMMIMVEKRMKEMSTNVWKEDFSSFVLIWKRMSMDTHTRSEIRFSVRNLCKSVNIARLSI